MQLSTMLEDTSGSRLGYPTTLRVTEIILSLPLNSILNFFLALELSQLVMKLLFNI